MLYARVRTAGRMMRAVDTSLGIFKKEDARFIGSWKPMRCCPATRTLSLCFLLIDQGAEVRAPRIIVQPTLTLHIISCLAVDSGGAAPAVGSLAITKSRIPLSSQPEHHILKNGRNNNNRGLNKGRSD